MSKAEERALKVYPIKIAKREGYDENLRERKGFVKGYHQAEKDLKLITIKGRIGWYDGFYLDYDEKEFFQAINKMMLDVDDKIKIIIIKDN